jgi:hypothetical protein
MNNKHTSFNMNLLNLPELETHMFMNGYLNVTSHEIKATTATNLRCWRFFVLKNCNYFHVRK